jgi:hypothetical protein
MKRERFTRLCSAILLIPLALTAEAANRDPDARFSSHQIELGIAPLIRFDRQADGQAAKAPASDLFLSAYARTDTSPIGADEEPSCKAGDCPGVWTWDVEGSLLGNIDSESDSAVWGRFNLYRPFWGNERVHAPKRIKNGEYDPFYLPPVTFGLSAGAQHTREQTEFLVNPYLQFHQWFNPDKCTTGGASEFDAGDGWLDVQECYFDITAELGADFVESDDDRYDRTDAYFTLDASWRIDHQTELSARTRYTNRDYDGSGIADEDIWTSELNLSRLVHTDPDANYGVYFDLALGYENSDSNHGDSSHFYVRPWLYVQVPLDELASRGTGQATGSSRSSRRGFWFR